MELNRRHSRYRAFQPVDLPDRTWPDARLSRAPRWLSTDLRDGNQALPRPMNSARKLELFDLLARMGYKEIEVGFPVASRDEYDFIRALIERDLIPDDVRISVLVQAREDLIRRTVESLRGARSATIHVYNATCPQFRELVFGGMTREQCKALAMEGTRLMIKYAEQELAGCDVGYEYSPELFNETELDFSLEVCEAVMDLWQPGPGREIVLNFPATVERSTPNVFADQIEWMHRNLSRREHVCLSVHPHNDRGTAVAAAELAMLAGAQRIEGCLFGGGERAGNVCLATLGLNLFTQGVDPRIDFSHLDEVRRTVEECTGMRVPERFPYGGELVFTAFSGSHQDAIKKGFDAMRREAESIGCDPRELPWQTPYLPVSPEDLGRSYEAVVRINSQSGKGGIAYVMSTWHGMDLPRGLQIEFAAHVQALADRSGAELTPEHVRACFDQEYLVAGNAAHQPAPADEPIPATLFVDAVGGRDADRHAQAVCTLEETLAPWGVDAEHLHVVGRSDRGPWQDGPVKVYAACWFDGRNVWGAGVDPDLHTAAFQAVCAAAVRAGRAPAASAPVAAIVEDAFAVGR